MSDEVNYQTNWADEATQCKNCKYYQNKNEQHACVPEDKTFEESIAEYGEIQADAHCNYFSAKS